MLTAEDVKRQAKAFGADLVGIAPLDRYEGAPLQMDPRQIMPEARSMIALGFRIMRGSLRGVEEGTFFSNYSSMGYGGLNWLYIPMTVLNLAKFIEDYGYEAIPLGHLSCWRGIDNVGNPKSEFSRPVAAGKPQPDVMIHLRIAAYLAGLGEIGYSKMLLTPQFGPRQRLGVVLTEAELAPDPIYQGPVLCDRCMKCVAECPGDAISATQTVTVKLAGNTVEWNDLDCDACATAFVGGMPIDNEEEAGDYIEGYRTVKPSPISPFYKKPGILYGYGQAICGGKGCIRACMIHLEERGVLQNEFKKPFRRRKPWRVDWSAPLAKSEGEPDCSDGLESN